MGSDSQDEVDRQQNGCVAAGCGCRDGRIVSPRRAAASRALAISSSSGGRRAGALSSAGAVSAAATPMMMSTTSSSIRVKPRLFDEWRIRTNHAERPVACQTRPRRAAVQVR